MKIMGLDYGSVTVGVAISDSMLLTAQPVEVIKRKSENKLRQTLARIQVLAEENDVGRIVLGYPKNMNNSEGERVERTKEFMEKLKARTGLEVVLWDERLSTVSAMDVLKEGGVRSEHRKTYVDKIAASLILQGYLDSIHNQEDLMSENENGLIMLTADDGSEEAFFVLEKADIAGVSYLLVTDSSEDEEAEAMILREETEYELVTYQVVDDEKELKIISKYLEELLDDVELRLE